LNQRHSARADPRRSTARSARPASILLHEWFAKGVRMDTQTVDKLNSFLRGEISAVETYRQAIEKLRNKPEVAALSDCLRSHEQRVTMLKEEVLRRGGEPARGSGTWGTFAKP
jgi:hypothetical protein